jgi:hypothetical protein
MRWQDAEFAFSSWEDNSVHLIREDAGFGGDDFEFERHERLRGKWITYFFGTVSMPPFM